ncbi:MAG: hypothetical protein ACOY30_10120 [Bacillota bacterium]
MRKKFCPRCKMSSFSSCKEVWICPYCGEDISDQPDYNINDEYDNNIHIKGGKCEGKKSV